MNLAIIGTGYVGLVTGTCFAEMGNYVTCIDIDNRKIENLNKGIVPIYEPGLKRMIDKNLNNTLFFTTSFKNSINNSDIVFIAVGTPQDKDGSADLQYVLKAAQDIGKNMDHPLLIVDKSTVPVGTADKVKKVIHNELNSRKINIEFDVVSNPEFLKEGDAVNDFMKPDRVIVGADNKKSMDTMKELYRPFTMNHERFIEMDIKSAELTKYAANAMLATKISFINELANIAEKVGANINKIRIGIGSDRRIGYGFIYPGIGWGGSCFPKDVKALEKMAIGAGIKPKLISAVNDVNSSQKLRLVQKIIERFGSKSSHTKPLNNLSFAIWGLSFKPETDDMREAPSVVTIKKLTEYGANINVYDPQAMNNAKNHYLKNINVKYSQNKYDCLNDADAMLLITEWKEFRSPDFYEIKQRLKNPIIFDGRNQYDKDKLKNLGFEYYQIGVNR